VIVSGELEQPRPGQGAEASDAVTFAFGDTAAEVFGVVRIALSGEPATGSGLAILFAGDDVVAVRAAGGEPVAQRRWEAVAAAGVSTTVDEPLAAWTVSVAQEDATGIELAFAALSEPSWLDASTDVGQAGGMEGYEQLCRVTGTATIARRAVPIDCLGQRGHSWGAPDWDKISRARTVNAWVDDELALSLTAIAPAGRKASNHDSEALAGALFVSPPRDEEEPDPRSRLVALDIAEPRLSTTFDADGHQLRAGFELVLDPDLSPRRGAGEVRCGTSLDLGRLRLDCAFFTWRMEGREGVGRYDVVRRA